MRPTNSSKKYRRRLTASVAALAVATTPILPINVVSTPPAFAQESAPKSITDVLANPWTDALGFQPVAQLSTAEQRAAFLASVEAFVTSNPSTENDQLLAQARSIVDVVAYTQDYPELAQASVLDLSARGNAGQDRSTTNHYLSYDNRDFSGLAVDNNVQSVITGEDGIADVYVWLERTSSDNAYISWRPVGVTSGNGAGAVAPQVQRLQNGFNHIRINLSQRNTPVAIYFHNDSFNAAQVRILAADAAQSADHNIAASYQPASAATGNLGSQLQTYPTYTYNPDDDAASAAAFSEFLVALRQQAADVSAGSSNIDMNDIRLGLQDFSGSATRAAIAYQDETDASAYAMIQQAYEISNERIDFYETFRGMDASDADLQHRSPELSRVTLNSNNLGGLWATNGYYYITGENQYVNNLRGNLSGIWNWGMNHEYGHMIDNSPTTINVKCPGFCS